MMGPRQVVIRQPGFKGLSQHTSNSAKGASRTRGERGVSLHDKLMDSRSNVRTGGLLAVGGWLAGLLYDYLGYHAPAFAVGIGANILNLLMVSVLVARKRHHAVAV